MCLPAVEYNSNNNNLAINFIDGLFLFSFQTHVYVTDLHSFSFPIVYPRTYAHRRNEPFNVSLKLGDREHIDLVNSIIIIIIIIIVVIVVGGNIEMMV